MLRAQRSAKRIVSLLCERDLLEISDSAVLQRDLAILLEEGGRVGAARLGAWLTDHPVVEEVLATDEELADVLAAVTAKRPTRNARNRELEQAILAEPDDVATRLVYADWLSAQGDPLGELMVASSQPSTSANQRLLRTLFQEHGDYFFGRLEEYKKLLRVETLTGLVDSVTIARKTPLEIEWAVLLGWLFEAPVARFLRSLNVGVIAGRHSYYPELMDALAARSGLGLRELVFETDPTPSAFRLGGGSDVGTLPDLTSTLPELRRLVVRALRLSVGALDHPRLEELELSIATTSVRLIERVGSARWPALRALTLLATLSDPTARGVALAPLLAGEGVPRLEALTIGFIPTADLGFVQQLCASPLVARLASLDLSQAPLDAAALELLGRERRAGRLSHLASFAMPSGWAE